jgi:hypothetical protein
MTQQQLVQEFRTYPKAQKSVIIRQLLRIFEEDLEETEKQNGGELSIEERKAIVESLSGIAAAEGKNAPFTIDALRLYPREGFDFDNIGKLIEQAEGDFHK